MLVYEVPPSPHLGAIHFGAEVEMDLRSLLCLLHFLCASWSTFVQILQVGPGGARRAADDEVKPQLVDELHGFTSATGEADVPALAIGSTRGEVKGTSLSQSHLISHGANARRTVYLSNIHLASKLAPDHFHVG